MDVRTVGNEMTDMNSVVQTSTLSNGDTDLEDMLQNAHLQKGLLRPLERLPLPVKLILLLVVSTVGLIVLGAILIQFEAKNIQSNRKVAKSSGAVTGVGNLIHELQTERAQALLLLSPTADVSSQLFYYKQQITTTDEEFLSYLSVLNSHTSLGRQYRDALPKVKTIQTELSALRTLTQNLDVTDLSALESYTSHLTTLQNILTGFLAQSISTNVVSYNVLIRLKESLSVSQAFMAVQLTKTTIESSSINTFVVYTGQTSALRSMFEAVSSSSVLAQFYKAFPQENDQLDEITQAIIDDPANRNIGAQAWYIVNNIRLEKLHRLENTLGKIIAGASRDQLQNSKVRIGVILMLIVLFWVGSIAAALMFSQIITGPWQRMVKVQNLTIKRFVPKGFLRMLKINKIADLSLSKSLQRDLSVMYIHIKSVNSDLSFDHMKPNEVFALLNKYLDAAGPVIRKYGGYIDKFLGEKLLVAFPSYGNSMRCSLELQNLLPEFNQTLESDMPKVFSAIGIYVGKVLVGTVGENDRIDGQIIGDTVKLAAKLQEFSKIFNTKIVTSLDCLKHIKGDQTHIITRPLGMIRTKNKGKKSLIQVVEVIDQSEAKRIESIKTFNDVVSSMSQHDYAKAIELLEQVIVNDKTDFTAVRVKNQCVKFMKRLDKQVARISLIHDVMLHPELWEDFEQFCVSEQSDENYKFWMAIEQDYNKAKTKEERKQVVRVILMNYLVADAPLKVNTSASRTAFIQKALEEENLHDNLFEDLKKEIEHLMTDTFTRYKRTERIKEIMKKSMPPCALDFNDN